MQGRPSCAYVALILGGAVRGCRDPRAFLGSHSTSPLFLTSPSVNEPPICKDLDASLVSKSWQTKEENDQKAFGPSSRPPLVAVGITAKNSPQGHQNDVGLPGMRDPKWSEVRVLQRMQEALGRGVETPQGQVQKQVPKASTLCQGGISISRHKRRTKVFR